MRLPDRLLVTWLPIARSRRERTRCKFRSFTDSGNRYRFIVILIETLPL